jgi:hypothetical protein
MLLLSILYQLVRCRRRQHPDSYQSTWSATGANAICDPMIGTLRCELLDRVLVVNERHLRRIVTIYLNHLMPRGHTGHWRNLPPIKPGLIPHKSSTWPATGFAVKQYSTGSPASTRSRLDRIDARRSAGQHHNPIFEFCTLRLRLLDCRYARRMVCRLL